MDATALIGQAQDAYSTGLQARNTQAKAGGLDEKRAKTAADSFESFFVGQMLEYMTQGVGVDEEFGGGHAEEMWRSMLNQEYGKHIVKSGGLGISNQVMGSMLKAQEDRSTAEQKLAALPAATTEATGDTATAAAVSAAAQYRR